MNRHHKSPSTKALPKHPNRSASREKTPQKTPAKPVQAHKHTSSTPAPGYSPSPARGMILKKKESQQSISFQKVDLRKGIFSNKQIFCKKILEVPRKIGKESEPLISIGKNKYQVLSKEFKLSKMVLQHKKPDTKDNEGFYIPDKPPFIHEDTNALSSNRLR